MICQYVSSSNLSYVCYEAMVQHLDITFHSGSTYRYTSVPAYIHGGLIAASSKGRYFDRYIKGIYPYYRIR